MKLLVALDVTVSGAVLPDDVLAERLVAALQREARRGWQYSGLLQNVIIRDVQPVSTTSTSGEGPDVLSS